jgi:hypothetical protein
MSRPFFADSVEKIGSTDRLHNHGIRRRDGLNP